MGVKKRQAKDLRDLWNILNIPPEVAEEECGAFAKKTVERLTLLADLFCEAAKDGSTINMSEEIEQAMAEHKKWRDGRGS